MKGSLTRRQFVARTAGAAVFAGFPAVLSARLTGAEAPSRRIAIGVVGTGDHGVKRNIANLLTYPDAHMPPSATSTPTISRKRRTWWRSITPR
jgi:hypothetical protein